MCRGRSSAATHGASPQHARRHGPIGRWRHRTRRERVIASNHSSDADLTAPTRGPRTLPASPTTVLAAGPTTSFLQAATWWP